MTTDSFVVRPIRFPGGSIGELAVNGTVNDLAVSGARPLALSLALVLEEGLPADELRAEVEAAARAAEAAGVQIVTGDTKVVERGHADKMYACTTGVGVIDPRAELSTAALRPGDRIIVSGPIGEHGSAIMLARDEFELEAEIESDTQLALAGRGRAARGGGPGAARDARRHPRRRGLGAQRAGPRLERGDARERGARCRSSPRWRARRSFWGSTRCTWRTRAGWWPSWRPSGPTRRWRRCARCRDREEAAEIGEVRTEPPGMVLVDTAFGGRRVMDLLAGDPLPRIC